MHACYCCRNAARHDEAQQGPARGERRATRYCCTDTCIRKRLNGHRTENSETTNTEKSFSVLGRGGVNAGTCGVIYGHESTTASCAFHSICQHNLHTISSWFSQAAANYNINDWGCTTASGEEGSAQKSTREIFKGGEQAVGELPSATDNPSAQNKCWYERKRQDTYWIYSIWGPTKQQDYVEVAKDIIMSWNSLFAHKQWGKVTFKAPNCWCDCLYGCIFILIKTESWLKFNKRMAPYGLCLYLLVYRWHTHFSELGHEMKVTVSILLKLVSLPHIFHNH